MSELLRVFIMYWIIFSKWSLSSPWLFLFDNELFETLLWVFEKCFQNIESSTPVFLHFNSELEDIQKIIILIEHVFLNLFRLLVKRISIIENSLNTDHLLIILLVVINVVFSEDGIFLHRSSLKLHFIVTRSFDSSSWHNIIKRFKSKRNLNFKIITF